MKKIKVGGKSKLVPRKMFVYHSVIHGLTKLVCRPAFLKKCEHWRIRSSTIPTDTYTDIYEGQIWKDFHSIDGSPFLSLPNNLCLMLNVDWFNPYDHTPYSAGVIYFVVQNLPRNERFKIENVVLAGLIPGPSEPKNMNTYLSPVVDDLEQLFNGVIIVNKNSVSGTSLVRACLSCISCDYLQPEKYVGFTISMHLKDVPSV